MLLVSLSFFTTFCRILSVRHEVELVEDVLKTMKNVMYSALQRSSISGVVSPSIQISLCFPVSC